MRVLRLRLPPQPGSVARARDAIDELAGILSEGSLEDVRLMLSELVTNSIRHARLDPTDLIEVTSDVRENVLHTSVRDAGAGFLPPTWTVRTIGTGDPGDDRGWGLYLVGRLADRWGVSEGAPTTVWFDVLLDRSGRAVRGASADLLTVSRPAAMGTHGDIDGGPEVRLDA